MKNYLKIIPDVLVIVFFVIISVAYFWNPLMDGKVLTGVDHDASLGSGVEMQRYSAAHRGERTRWTNTIFSGMPTYQMSPSYDSTEMLGYVQDVYQLWLPSVAAYVFMMLLGFYILLRAFDFRAWMAALGAVLWAFSSYYFIIIAAGHIWKFLTLCYIPPTIAGVVLCYRGKYLWGVVVTAIFTALQILSNHVQMSYYFLSVILFIVIAYLINSIRTREYIPFLKASGCALLGAAIGICINLSNLYHTYEYSKETMRGKTELTHKTKDAADQTNSGLERSYITAWSYGIGETWTLLVPNAKGGASVPLTRNKDAMAKASNQYLPLYQQLGQYWGEQPGTSGPVYVGAFVLFLFVLGLFIVRGPMKWCLLAATCLSILLSWGKNFMPFTDFFLDYVPMYDKFRTVASILVIAEFTIPMLGMLALKRLADEPDFLRGRTGRYSNMTYMYISLALTAGVCLLFWLMPDVFFGNYVSTVERAGIESLAQYGWPVQDVIANLSEMRRAMFTADAMRSFLIIIVGFVVLMVYRWRKIGTVSMCFCLIVLCLADLWGVNKRYLNDEMFVRPTPPRQAIPMTYADTRILQDPETYYRVLNLTVNTFNDNTTSFYHKSVGGYHAAKLRRYQELIEEHILPEMESISSVESLDSCGVLNMLNTKYLITDPNGEPVENPYANGNAWFVDDLQYVADADEEIGGLHGLDTKRKAVADRQFEQVLGEAQPDSTASVRLTSYEANALSYEANSTKGGVIVFSDIFYPGWTCTVDGAPAEIGRVDYVLRAIHIAEGKHEVKMKFDPQTLHTTETIAYVAWGLLVLLFLGSLLKSGLDYHSKRKP
ncbi:MAG: YfhO family protein [Prevotellaceae bacterium]|nr:YfhO family protein [Prevotellaceae bacterium]